VSEWPAADEGYAAWLLASGASRATLRMRRHYFNHLAAAFPDGPWTVTADDLVRFLAVPAWRPETRKSARSTVRGLYRWALDTGRISVDPSRGLPRVRIPATVPRPAPGDVIGAALAGSDPRARLMVMLGAYAGLRCGEIAALHTRDVVGDSLRVCGKGGRTRTIPLHPVLAEALAVVPEGFVFPGQIDGHLSPGYVSKVVKRSLGDRYSSHTVRHAFASRAYAQQRDLLAVQTLLGHSKPETTARYTAVPDGALRAAVMSAWAENPVPVSCSPTYAHPR